MSAFLNGWAGLIYRRAGLVFLAGLIIWILSLFALRSLTLSTDINALMPEGAQSVQTLENAEAIIGDFSPIRVVVEAESRDKVIESFKTLSAEFGQKPWVDDTRYFEDVEVLIRHELLYLAEEELVDLEQEAYRSLSIFFAKEMASAFQTDVTFTLNGVNGSSYEELDPELVEEFEKTFSAPPADRRYFVVDEPENGLYAGVMIVAPKPGNSALAKAKIMVQDSLQITDDYRIGNPDIFVGVTGRITSQVGQFDAVTRDLMIGLGSAFALISLILLFSYRSFMAIPLIVFPLIVSLIATLAVTALTIGGLNLITAFLTLILFGLGIDFGVHNFSRYTEERRAGTDLPTTIQTIVNRTGRASFMAAITTGGSFFALMMTQFRAFSEFGFIAGVGMLLAFFSMYTLMPATLVLVERLGWTPKKKTREPKSRNRGRSLFALRHPYLVITAVIALMSISVYYAPKIQFETNTRNLEATMPDNYVKAKAIGNKVLGQSNSAVLVADSYDELIDIDAHFQDKQKTDTASPTIKQVRSLLSFVPPPDVQQRRLDVIRRLKEQADRLSGLDPEKYEASREYLDIETLSVKALPPLIRQTYMGQEDRPGYLYYITPDVVMADSTEAGKFYADAARVSIDGKEFFSASESFVLVEMLGLMQSDALYAVLLVTLTTIFVVWLFFRNVVASLVVLVPPLCGVVLTLGVMGAFGPALSIMNMVILPSLVGISVDNGIHIVHRYLGHSPRPDLGYIMRTTGRASLLTTVTTLVGFGGMITASMGGLRSLAHLAIIGFTLCLIMTWFLLPAILTILGKAQPNMPEPITVEA